MMAPTAAAARNSDRIESVWASSSGTVATVSVMAMAAIVPMRRRTTPWISTSHTQKQATMTSFRRS